MVGEVSGGGATSTAMAIDTVPAVVRTAAGDQNKLRPEDAAVHDWYRFVLSFPPHLVRTYIERFGLRPADTVLDPFCGTGTTLVECKKLGVRSVGVESNPMAHFASSVKADWSIEPAPLLAFSDQAAASAHRELERSGVGPWDSYPLFTTEEHSHGPLRELPPEQARLLLKDSISPLPLHKSLVLLEAIDRYGDNQTIRYGRLALAQVLVRNVGNLKFGPEVGIGRIKHDAPVVEVWHDAMRAIARDIALVDNRAAVSARSVRGDARSIDIVLEPTSIDAVITSPPYPNEKDYTRTTRLESVILGFIRDRLELRALKQGLVRSNTRGVYKRDTDDREVAAHAGIREIANTIEKRRVAMGKTSGFERMYPRVTRLYFGGMFRHLASLRLALKPSARLAYVVGDQASYLRVMIRTGQILADLAESLGYRVQGIDLFRTRPSTVTGEQLREEVVVLEWPGT